MSVTSTPKGSDLELDALEAVARRAEAASEDGWLSPLSPEGEDLWNELDPPTILSLISAARKGQGECEVAIEAVRGVLEIADQRAARELAIDAFDSGFIALRHFADAIRAALPPPSKQEE